MKRHAARTRAERLERLIQTRLPAAGMRTMAELARRTGIDANTFSAWKTKGTHPSVATMRTIADTLGIPERLLWDAYEGVEEQETTQVAEAIRAALEPLVGRLEAAVARLDQASARVQERAEGVVQKEDERPVGEAVKGKGRAPSPRRARGSSRPAGHG